MLQYLSTSFIAGILALLPLLITVAVAWFVYSKLLVWFGPGSRFGKLPKLLAEKTAMHPVWAYFSIFGLVVVIIIAIGAIAKRSTEQKISQFVERIPILRSIYGGTESVVSALQLTDRGVPRSFTKVVMAKIANASALGLQTSREPIEVDGERYISIYFPNTPLPATGQLYLVPEADVREVDMSVEEMMQVYVSMGSLTEEAMLSAVKHTQAKGGVGADSATAEASQPGQTGGPNSAGASEEGQSAAP